MPRFYLKNAGTTIEFDYVDSEDLCQKLTERGLPQETIRFLIGVK